MELSDDARRRRTVELPDDPEMTVRPATDRDVDGVVAFYAGYPPVRRSMGIPPLGGVDAVRPWVERVFDEGRNVVAVDATSRVRGHGVVLPATATIPELAAFVDPGVHDRGIGTAVCDLLLDVAREAGHEGVRLSVANSNRRAIHVYEKLGFEVADDPETKLWQEMRRRFDGE